MQTTKPTGRSQRLSREEFLARALDVLSREGESELRIDRLTRALGITKGSFYWHFKNRAEFVRTLAEYWEKWSTGRVIEEIENIEDDPKKLLLKIDEIVTHEELARYDLVMRSWATHEPEVARIVESVDRTRFDYVRRLFRQLGFRGEDLDLRTRMFVVTTSLWSVINRDEDRKQRLRRLAAALDILTAR